MAATLQAVEVYTPGTKAWFADKEEAWVSATCVSNTVQDGKVRLVFQGDADGKVSFTRPLQIYGLADRLDTC